MRIKDILVRIDASPPSTSRVERGLAQSGCTWRHNVGADATYSVGEGVDEGDILLNVAASMGDDLFVVGGYGRSRIRELIFGGLTRSLLTSMTVLFHLDKA